jgi:hypothetical protein
MLYTKGSQHFKTRGHISQLLCQKGGQKHSKKIANRSFENVAKFQYLGRTITDQNCMHEEIKRGLSSGNACYHLVQSLLSPRLLSRNVKVKIFKIIILSVVLYGCEIWSLISREEHRLRVFEKKRCWEEYLDQRGISNGRMEKVAQWGAS